MEWKTHLITSKPRKRNLFFKEELVSSDIEETAGCRSLSKRKKSFPKEKSVNDPEESGNKRVPKEKEKILFQGRPTQQWTLGGFCQQEQKVKVSQYCLPLRPHGFYSPSNSPGQNTGVDSLSLLQGIFPTLRLNPGLPHCGQILYRLSHKGSPKILDWVAYPFSSRSSQPRN